MLQLCIMRLFLNGITVAFGDKEVLNNIKFEVNSKDKVALIGRNGSGKTTLLKVVTGEQEINLDSKDTLKDKIQKTGKFEIGYLKQIAFDNDNETLEGELLKCYVDILSLKGKIAELENRLVGSPSASEIEKYQELVATFDRIGGYTYQKEYNTALKKFGFAEEDKAKKLSEFSGGQRTKIALIKLLLGKPDLLILDEPTNHLDITSIKWLEEYLSSYPKAMIVVSHDRAFLDRFVNVVYEIERHQMTRYVGNYSDYARTKSLNYEKQLKEYKAHVEEKARLQAVADRFRYKATKASMAQSKLKAIERMGNIDVPLDADARVFTAKSTPRIESGYEVITADNISIGYDKVLTKLSFQICKGDRIGVVGGNGLGKSTLLKSLVGKIPLLGGRVKWGTNVEVGYFDQQTATEGITSETVLENFMREYPSEDTENARRILGSFCFSQDDVFKNMQNLSGGERVRLGLCKMLRRQPNFLILDEPTNHMDIMGKEALESALQDYKGTIIFVSHDRYFVRKIATSLIVFENGGGKYYKDTTYAEYEEKMKESVALDLQKNVTQITATTKPCVKEEKVNEYQLNKERARRNNKRIKLEQQIADKEAEIVSLKSQMELPNVCSDYVKLMELQKQIDVATMQLDVIMEEWLALSEE